MGCELEAAGLGIVQTGFWALTFYRGCAASFQFSHIFVCDFVPGAFINNYRRRYGKIESATKRLSNEGRSLKIDLVIPCPVPLVRGSCFFRAGVWRKLFDIGSPYGHHNSLRFAYPSKSMESSLSISQRSFMIYTAVPSTLEIGSGNCKKIMISC